MQVKSLCSGYTARVLGLLLLTLLFCAATRPAAAQVLYGSVIGTISDPSGAVIPGATVTLTSNNTYTVPPPSQGPQ